MRILFTFLLVSWFSFSFGQSWQTLGPAEEQMPSSGSSAKDLSMTTDEDGVVYIVYGDGNNGGKATVKKFNTATNSWEVVGTAGISEGVMAFSGIAADTQKTLYIIYSDEAVGRKAVVKFFDTTAGEWKTAGTEGISTGEATFSRIITVDNEVFAVFADAGQGGKVVVKRYDRASGSWKNAGSNTVSSGTASDISVSADSGNLYIAYQDGAAGNRTTVRKFSLTAAAWEGVGNAGFSLGTAAAVKLASAEDKLYVAYSDGANGNKVTVQEFSSVDNQWVVTGSVGFTASATGLLALIADKNKMPYLLFRDGSASNKATVYRYTSADQRWEQVGIKGFSSGAIESPSLALGADGSLFLAYSDASLNDQAVVKSLNTMMVRWESFGIGNSINSNANHISMAVDGGGIQYLVYGENENSGKAVVKKFDAARSSWQTVGTESISKGLAAFTSIAIGPDRRPVIAYQDGGNFNKVTVQKLDQNGQWRVVGNEGFSAGAVSYTSITVDKAGKIWVVYRDVINGNRAVVQKYNEVNGEWETIGTNLSAGAAAYTSIVTDRDGIPHIVYQDRGQGDRIAVKRYDAMTSSWQPVGPLWFSPGSVSYTNLAFDGNNVPYVIYMDGTASNRATVQRYNAASLKWEVVGHSGFSSGTAAFTALALDSDNVPVAIYQDGSKGNRVTVASFNQMNGLWEVTSENISVGGANYTSINAYQNKLFVAYQDGGLRGNAVVKSFSRSSGSWLSMGISSSDALAPLHNSMVADKDNDIYLFYGNDKLSTVKKLNRSNGAWSVLGGSNAVDGSAHFGSMAIASNKVSYIAYSDVSAGDKITVKRFVGTAWEVLGGAGFSSGKANYTAVVTDDQDEPYVVYQDEGNSAKGVVRKFDAATSSWKAVGSTISAQTASYTAIATIGNEIYVAYSDGAKNGRVTVKRFNAGTNSWISAGIEGFSAGKASYISMTADHNGVLYVVYQDAARADRAVVKKFNTAKSTWETVGADGISTGAALFTKISVDATGRVYLVYRDSWNSDKATVKTYNETKGAWETIIRDGFSDGSVTYPALAVAPSGDVYASFANNAFAGGLQVVKLNRNTSVWENSGSVTVSSGKSASYVSGIVNHDGVPYVAYRENQNKNIVTVKKYDAIEKEWNVVGNANASDGPTSFTSLAASPADTIWVAYQDSTADNRIAVRFFNPGSSQWELATGSHVSEGAATLPSIAIGADNIPYVAYADSNKNYQLTVKRLDRTAATWVTTGPAGFSAAAVNSTSIVVSDDGVPYVAYVDAANGNRATVKRYAFGTDSWESVGADNFTQGSATTPSLVFDRNGKLAVVYIDGSSQNRLTVQRYDALEGWKLIGAPGFSFGSAGSPTLTFDQDNVPVVAYWDSGNGNRISAQRYNSNRDLWEAVGMPGFSISTASDIKVLNAQGKYFVVSREANGQAQMRVFSQNGLSWQVLGYEGVSEDFPASYSSVTAGPQGETYVVFQDGQYGQKATVKEHNSSTGAWETVGNAGFSAGEVSFNAIVAGSTGIFVAYSDGGNTSKLAAKKYNKVTQKWEDVGGVAISNSVANYVSLALGVDGAPLVAYQDAASGNRTTVQRYNSGASRWEVLGKAGFSDASASHQSLFVASDNSVWVAYTDASRGNRATAKKFNTASSTWETVGDAGFSIGATSYTNIVIDAKGIPIVAYMDASNGNRITVQRFQENRWSVVGTVGFSEPSGGYLSLVIDNDNIPYVSYRGQDARVKVSRFNPHLQLWEQVGTGALSIGAGAYTSLSYAGGKLYAAYQDAGLANQVAVKQFITSGGGWEDLGSGRVSSAVRATFADVAVDNKENIYITYQDVNGGNKASVKSYRKDKNAWEVLGSSAISEGAASYTSLALSKDGTPYISYQDGNVFNKLTAKRYNPANNSWEALGTAGITDGTVSYNDIADLSGFPLVVFADGANGGKLSSMSFDGTAWQSAGTAISAGQAVYPSLASDLNSTAFVAYLDASLGRMLVVKKYDATAKAWSSIGGETATAHRADFPSIALDKAGTPYIAYQDSAFQNRVTVQKYDAAGGKWVSVGSEGFSAGAVSYTSIYVDESDRLFVLYRDGGKLNRATVKRFNATSGNWETVADEGFSVGAVTYNGLAGTGTSVYAGYIDDGLGAVVDVKKMNENATGWDISGEMGISSGTPVAYTSVLTNSKNVPLMLFSDGGKGNSVTVKQYDAASGSWSAVGTNDISAAGVQYPAFAGDSKDELYVAFADASQGNRILAKRFNKKTSEWETFGKGTFSLQAAAHISLAVSANDQPYVAFRDQWNANKITVRRYNPAISNWEIVGTDGFSDGAVEYSGIALDKSNVPYATYVDVSLGNKIVVKALVNDNWETLDPASLTTGSYSSIVVDSNNVVYVAYRDDAQGGKATVKYYDTTSATWRAVGNEGFTPGEASFTSVKVDKFNIPYLVYQDGSADNKVSVSRYNVIKKEWEVVGTWGISATVAAYPSMAIDRVGKPYIAYSSGQAFARAYDGVTTISEQPQDTSVCKEAEGKFAIKASGNENSYQWQVNDGSGFKNLSDDQVYSGVNTAELTIAAVPETFKGYKYRVLIIGDGVAMSDEAVVGINDFDVALLPNPELKASESIKYEQQLPLSGGVAPYSYSLAGGVLPAGLELTADGKITGKPAVGSKGVYNFTVQLVESSVCKNVAVRDFTLTVEEVPADNIQVTQVVTPNGDGKNDYLAIPGIEAYPDNYLYIMNRNGTRVYQMKGYDNSKYPFVGRTTYGSENLPAGTYFYVLEFTDKADGKTRRQTGYVVLRY